MQINNTSDTSIIHFSQNEQNKIENKIENKIPEYKSDSFEKVKDGNINKSNNEKFDISECFKNFGKGVLSPLKAIIEHPIVSIGAVLGSALLCSLVPVMTPIMAVGFGALSVFQLGKGIYEVGKNIKNKEYDNAEKAFNAVGQGTIGTVMSVTGMKQSSKIAKEAKLMSELKTTTLTKAQQNAIALETKNGSYIDAFKEVGKLFTTKDGLKAVGGQFKPSNILQRGKNMYNHLFTKEEVTGIKKERVDFKDTKEGQRRANLSTEEIEQEVQKLYKEAFDEYGIPEELRPKVEIIQGDTHRGGGYNSQNHSITINESTYREGVFDLPNVIKHEATHAKEAILREKLPVAEKEKLAQEYLLNKIQNGDKENVVVSNTLMGYETIKAPKLTEGLKRDFAQLAKDKLYTNNLYSNDDFLEFVKPLIDANPDFVAQYGSADEAMQILMKYAKSHQMRYRFALNGAGGFNTQNVDISKLKDLAPDELLAAKKSYIDGIDCLESNAANQQLFFGDFDQYQFTPEEVLAQVNGNNFEISKLQAQLDKLHENPNFDITEEARLLDKIKQCKLTIEYKTKGKEMYRLFTESINHPENKELAQKVAALKEELSKLDTEINSISWGNKATEYSIHTEMVNPELGATVSIPKTTTVAVDILEEDKDKAEK